MSNQSTDNAVLCKPLNNHEIGPNLGLRAALDWLEISIYCDMDFCDWFRVYINNYLFRVSDLKPDKYHFLGFGVAGFGFRFSYDVKPRLKNSFAVLELTGRFFRLQKSHDFIDSFLSLLRKFDIRYVLTRCDAALDFQSFSGIEQPFIPNVVYNDTGLAAPLIHRYKETPQGIAFDGFQAGKSDANLRVYNKLAENPDYCSIYSVSRQDILSCWRVEFEFRSQSFKDLQLNLADAGIVLDSSEKLFNEVFGQFSRRYTLSDFQLPSSPYSAYRPKKPLIEHQIRYWYDEALRAYKRYLLLSSEAYQRDIFLANTDAELGIAARIDLQSAFERSLEESNKGNLSVIVDFNDLKESFHD